MTSRVVTGLSGEKCRSGNCETLVSLGKHLENSKGSGRQTNHHIQPEAVAGRGTERAELEAGQCIWLPRC